MKKWNLFFCSLIIFVSAFSQTETAPLYKRFPTVPPLNLLLVDSSTIFTEKNLKKNKAVFINLFSPDCEHCQKETEELIDSIAKFKNIQIVMATTLSFDKMKAFYDKNQLGRFPNIVVGQDRQLILPTFYKIKNFPFLAFYDKNGKLIDVAEGALPISKVLFFFRNKN
jgi:thiol-disulfide isomerase/thioredoxin